MNLVDPKYPDWGYCHHDGVRQLLGLRREAKLPEHGMPPRMVQGIKIWVEPLKRIPGRKSSTHRVLAECACGQVLSAGRLHQHVCKKGE